jgi:cytidine deaminase
MDAAGFDPEGALAAADLELIEAAREALLRRYRPFWHTIAAAMRGRDGRIWTGLHLGATVGRLSICAEAVALGRAVLEGGGDIVATVAVRHPKPEEPEREPAIVPPCGACLDMLTDHAPGALVIVPGPRKLPVRALLALPYRR